MATSDPDPLIAAYRATSYRVCLATRTLEIRHGERCDAVDELLGDDAPGWAHVTAWNPRSVKRAAEENDRRQAALEHMAVALGFRALPGWGVGADEEWSERGCLILGIDRQRAVLLGRLFEQRAIVVGARGEAAEVVSCEPPPVAAE